MERQLAHTGVLRQRHQFRDAAIGHGVVRLDLQLELWVDSALARRVGQPLVADMQVSQFEVAMRI